jgi:tyrosyl-tRNA synthetase
MDGLEYWDTVLRVAKNLSLKRVKRATTIMGREMHEQLSAAQLMYPCMQVSDIFMLGVDVCQLGMDQRRANILARELAPKLGKPKPVAVHHHMLLGLKGKQPESTIAESKMSKSVPESAIFVHDSVEEIERKLSKAFCPAKQLEENPVIELCKYVIFERFDKVLVERDKRFGGDVEFSSFEELASHYVKGELHPLDLKRAVARYIDKLVAPVREHFEKHSKARALLEQVQGGEITR